MIRKYEKSDLEELLDVWYESSSIAHPFLSSEFMDQERKNIRTVHIPNAETWVFINENSVDGFISMIGNEVGAIFVRPEKQGLGIGKSLMDFVSQFHEELEVEVFMDNKIGRQFYNKYGFRIVGKFTHEATKCKMIRMKFNR